MEFFILSSLAILNLLITQSWTFPHPNHLSLQSNSSRSPPHMEIFGIDKQTQEESLWAVADGNNLTLVYEDRQRITIKCKADYPIDVDFEGVGDFNFIQRGRGSSDCARKENGVCIPEYRESTTFSILNEVHTGRYICFDKRFPERRSSFYIYVQGSNLLVNSNGQNIYVKDGQDMVTIPCVLSTPNATIKLLKVNEEQTEVTQEADATYNQTSGFTLNGTKKDGKYLCYANYKDDSYAVEYNVIGGTETSQQCNKSCPANSKCKQTSGKSGKSTCECDPLFERYSYAFGHSCLIKCESDDQCPDTMSCQPRSVAEHTTTEEWISDSITNDSVLRVCKNPCVYSQNGSDCNGKCSAENHKAICT